MSEQQTSYWQGTEIYQRLRESRQIFAGPNSETVRAVLSDIGALDRTKTTLEIGAGMGMLAQLVGEENWKHVFQTEPNFAALDANPTGRTSRGMLWRRREYSTKAVADVDNLPFADESLDFITGMACIDVLNDPKRSFREVMRTLRPGGSLLHFLDIIPDPHYLVKSQISQGKLLLPYSNDGIGWASTYTSLDMSDTKAVKQLLGMLQVPGKGYAEMLAIYPDWYRHQLMNSDQLISLIKGLQKYLGNMKTAYLQDLFAETMVSDLSLAGFQEVGSGFVQSSQLDRKSQLDKKLRDFVGDANLLMNRKGIFAPYLMPDEVERLGSDRIVLTSEMHVLIAKKSK